MKKSLFVLIFLMLTGSIHAVDWRQAKSKVMSLPCKDGGTVDMCLNKKASIKAVDDLGWKVFPAKNGFYVERMMLLGNRKLIYRWHVSESGETKPANGKAIGIQRQ